MSELNALLNQGLPVRDPLSFPVLGEELEKLAMTASALAEARQQTETSPSEAQAEAGNYKKGKVTWQGLTIAIENPKGSTRSGTSKSGKKWSQKMHHDYGYFLGSEGKDGDHVDVFIGPELESELVHVINQIDPDTNKFDEHKVVIGCTKAGDAISTYLANYEDGWQGMGSYKAMTVDDFKKWVLDRKATSKAAADYKERLKQLRKRRGECPGCGNPFGEDEPYPDVEMCETCERFGPPKEADDERKPTVAVDLDGTLAIHYDKFDPKHIPDPRPGAKKHLQSFRDAGARIIIFTVRGDDAVTKAWLKKHEIPYDYINENPDQPEGSSDKVYADVYWDDRAVSAAGRLASSAPQVLERLKVAEDTLIYSDVEDVLLAIQLFKEAA